MLWWPAPWLLPQEESLFADWKLWFTHCGQYLLGQVEKSSCVSSPPLSARLFISVTGLVHLGYCWCWAGFVCRAFDTLKLSLGEKRDRMHVQK